MKASKPGDDRCLEPPATLEPAFEHWRRRQRLARPDDIPLGADRALLGYVAALRRHG